MLQTPMKPFMIAKDQQGQVRLTVRETRYNSQGYPWVIETLLEDCFKTAAAARAYAMEQFGAKAGQFSTK